MNISWGHKIAAVYILFAAGIMVLVFKASRQSIDLVTPNYYEQELKYQDVIDQKAAARHLSAMPQYTTTSGTVQIDLPAEFEGKKWKGNVYLYRPSDAALDLRRDVAGQGRSFRLVLPKAVSGVYSIKFSYELDGEKFFDEKDVRF